MKVIDEDDDGKLKKIKKMKLWSTREFLKRLS